MCSLACPYGNIHFDVKLQVSRKCDLCGGKPKCVGHCIATALNYEEIEDYSARVRKRVDIQLAERMKHRCSTNGGDGEDGR